LGILLNMRFVGAGVAAVCATAALLVSTAEADAAKVAFFDDPAYVDTAGGSSAEADNLHASLVAQGHSVKTFTGITSIAWSRGLAGQQLLVISDLENGNLAADLTEAAEHTIRSYVATGGAIAITRSAGGQAPALLNDLFGLSLATAVSAPPYALQGGVGGTRYAGGPASLPALNSTQEPLSAASLPGGAKAIYANGDAVVVALLSIGSGEVAYLGWDWFDAAPVGTQNGGWLNVLNRTVNEISGLGCTISGSGGVDALIGTSGKDRICGFGGNDVIQARRGADIVFAGRGNDDVFGEGGNDRLFLEAGRDDGRGGAGNDFINGGTGADTCRQGPGNGQLISC
jgi:Ca2+-binding RTX toxin-like protein